MFIGRATAQLTQKHRINFSHEYQSRCEGAPLQEATSGACHTRGTSWIASAGVTTSPEAATSYIEFPYYLTQATWTAPVTNKILFEAGYTRLSYEHAGGPGQLPPDGIFGIGVTEQSTTASPAIGYVNPVPRANYVYRALSQYADNWSNPNHWRASASYVTGSHSIVRARPINEINAVQRTCLCTLQSGHPQPGQRGHPGLADGRHDVGGVVLRAGRVDAQPADAAGRAALRPCLELEPGREERGHWHVGSQPLADRVRQADERRCL
jgi:hypothetical protein